MRGWIVSPILFFALAVPSFGASQRDWDDCAAFDLGEKIAACTRIIDDRGEIQNNRARAYDYRGNAWRYKNELDRAIADYDEAINLNPTYAFPHNGRGLTWRAKGRLDRAIADFDEAIRLDPGYPKTYNNRGDAWRAEGQLDRAIADFDEAISLEPKYVLAYFNRGLTRRARDELDGAIADFDAAITLESGYAFAYFNRGLTWRAKGRLDNAIADFDEAIRLDPNFDAAYFNRGLTDLYGTDPASALADVSRAAKLVPRNPYFALWTDIVEQRLRIPDRLAQAVSKLDMTEWPAPILRLFLGQLTPSALLAATDAPEGKAADDQVCEANLYSGIMALREGKAKNATTLYQLAADRCSRISIEWYAAHAELRQLGR